MTYCKFCNVVVDERFSPGDEALYTDPEGKKHRVRILEDTAVCAPCQDKFGSIPSKE